MVRMDLVSSISNQYTHAAIIYGITILILNAVAFILMGFDKFKAKRQEQRVPEATFMLLGALGGAVGILLGMIIFKHKTSKRKFYIGVPLLYGLNKFIHFYVLALINK